MTARAGEFLPPRQAGSPAKYLRQARWNAFIFVIVSLCVTMSLHQLGTFERVSVQWSILIGSSIILPLLDLEGTIKSLMSRSFPLLVFMIVSSTWHGLRGDASAVLQLGLLVFVTAWINSGRVVLDVSSLLKLYYTLIIIGIAINYIADFSPYGLIPGRTATDFGVWRVSFFPNIAYSGALSLAVLMLIARDGATLRTHLPTLCVALYFLIFSFVRAAILGFFLFLAIKWWLERESDRSPGAIFLIVLLSSAAMIAFVSYAPVVIYGFQELPLISLFFLQNKSGLSIEQIYDQVYRPWLWGQHLRLAWESPWLMGWGAFDFAAMMQDQVVPIASAGTETLPTRLLASYGLLGAGYILTCISGLWCLCQRKDLWGAASFATALFLMMNWGSMFHPTDAMYVIFMLMILRGSSGFIWHDRA